MKRQHDLLFSRLTLKFYLALALLGLLLLGISAHGQTPTTQPDPAAPRLDAARLDAAKAEMAAMQADQTHRMQNKYVAICKALAEMQAQRDALVVKEAGIGQPKAENLSQIEMLSERIQLHQRRKDELEAEADRFSFDLPGRTVQAPAKPASASPVTVSAPATTQPSDPMTVLYPNAVRLIQERKTAQAMAKAPGNSH